MAKTEKPILNRVGKIKKNVMSKSQEGIRATAEVQNLGFVDFTTDLVRNVYTVITDSALEQLKAYGDFVAAVSQPLANYQKEVTGISFNDSDSLAQNVTKNQEKLDSYIEEVLGFTLDSKKTNIVLLEGKEQMLENHFLDTLVEEKNITNIIDKTNAKSITISKIDLQKFVYEKLAKSTSESYNMLVTVLKLGMQKVEVTDGSIFTKLVFHVDTNETATRVSSDVQSKASSWGVRGSASARWGWGRANVSGGYNSNNIKVSVVNEKSSSAVNLSADIIGSVKINFRSGSFPSYDKK